MKRFSCILMCLSMASMVFALSITNGDFEALGIREDVPDWFEEGGTYLRLLHSLNDTRYMGLADDDCWAYQSIGFNTGGLPALQIQYEIGSLIGGWPDEPLDPRNLVLTISLYESDGSFSGSDDLDIDGAEGVTRIDSVTVSYPGMTPDVDVVTDSVTLQYTGSASGELFLRFENEGDDDDDTDDRFSIDNVQIVALPSIVNPFPKDDSEFVAIERTSAENDLVFTVTDPAVTAVDILFAPDPNLFEANTIVDDMSVSPGQYTITLESEWPQDLDWSTNYFWQVLAYEPNGMELSLKYTSPAWNFTTIQEGPYLGDVTPERLAVRAGQDAVFSLTKTSKADAFQWYYYPDEGEPNEPLSNGTEYSGVDTDTLTIKEAQSDDAGYYFCIATTSGITAESTSSGRLLVGELKSHYPFETTYADGSNIYTPDIISGKDMQLLGGADLSDANSIVGKNLLLVNPDGARTQYASIADITVADYEDITIACWVCPTTLISSNERDRWNRVWDFGASSTEYFFLTMLYRQDDPRQDGWDVARSEWTWYTPDDNGDGQPERHNQELDVEAEIVPGEWYYMVVTVEDEAGRIYLNGECGTEDESPQGLNVQSPIDFTKTFNYIGKAINDTNNFQYLNGRIDDLKIYNYAMTKQEIAEEYNTVTGVESICDLEIYDLYDWDFNRNCRVDLPDFAEIAAKWLVDFRIYPD